MRITFDIYVLIVVFSLTRLVLKAAIHPRQANYNETFLLFKQKLA